MKTFFKKYSFGMVKLFITQCVLGLFGFVLALTALQADSLAVTVGIIALSIGFYLFLIYVTTWGFGSKDMPAFAGLYILADNCQIVKRKNRKK